MAGESMRIATFNVNSVRARLDIVTDWMREHRPDVMCLQETKVVDELFPAEPFEELGYHLEIRGQKAYNGVAVMSLEKPTRVVRGFEDGGSSEETRLMAARIRGVTVLNTYVPQGFDVESPKYRYKLEWLDRLEAWFRENAGARRRVVWVGDINVAPEPEDVHDPKRLDGHVCFNEQVREKLRRIVEAGRLVDVVRQHHPEPGFFTYFDYRGRTVEKNKGWRIDHVHATRPMAKRCTDAWVDMGPRRRERPSDHTVLVADFEL